MLGSGVHLPEKLTAPTQVASVVSVVSVAPVAPVAPVATTPVVVPVTTPATAVGRPRKADRN